MPFVCRVHTSDRRNHADWAQLTQKATSYDRRSQAPLIEQTRNRDRELG